MLKKQGLNRVKQTLHAHTSLCFNEYILAYIKRSGTQGQIICMTYTTTWNICKIWQRIHCLGIAVARGPGPEKLWMKWRRAHTHGKTNKLSKWRALRVDYCNEHLIQESPYMSGTIYLTNTFYISYELQYFSLLDHTSKKDIGHTFSER